MKQRVRGIRKRGERERDRKTEKENVKEREKCSVKIDATPMLNFSVISP